MNTDVQTLRTDRSALVEELKAAGAVIKGTCVKCPFHEDTHPSGSIYRDDSGVWRYKCQTPTCGFGGDVFDVRAKATGKDLAQVLAECSKREQPKSAAASVYSSLEQIERMLPGEIEAKYRYTCPETGLDDLIVYRIVHEGKKSFRQVSPVSSGFVMQAPPKPWPLYNRAQIASAAAVLVVEGEKCVHAATEFGVVATTSPCGAGKASYADWSLLAGKTIYLWPDNDDTGLKHMRELKQILEQLEPAPKIFWIDPARYNLAPKQDIADVLITVPTETRKAVIDIIMQEADAIGAASDVSSLIEDTIIGKRKAIEWPWRGVSKLARALLPGTVTLICGDPGSSKSFFLLEALAYWHLSNIKVAAYELEEDRKYHLYRSLAQRVENSSLFDDDWVQQNAQASRQYFEAHKEFLDSFGKCICEAPQKQVTLEGLVEWVESKCKSGCRIIAIDPLTAAQATDKPWVSDSNFIIAAKTVITHYGASLILVTHPKKGRKAGIGLDELAGGAAYARFAQTVLWLEHHKKLKEVSVESPTGRFGCKINKTLHICKTRNGIGHGLCLGFNFFGESLRFAEQGLIHIED